MAMVLQPSRLRVTQAIYYGKQPGSGVVSINDGNGIQNTPDPIISTGTVALGLLTSDHDFGNFRIDAQNTTRWFNVVAFGADPTGVADSSAGITAAIAAATLGGVIYFPRGTYLMVTGVSISTAGTHLVGDGRDATKINFNPAGPSHCFDFSAGAGTINNCGIGGMTFLSPNVVNTKVAVQVADATNFYIDGINVTNGWTGGSSIGFRISGRQEIRVTDCAINSADFPIVIAPNPNIASISFDHSSIEGCELVVTAGATNPAILISDGLSLTNAAFKHLAFVAGGAGISMNNTTQPVASQVIIIEDIRSEQGVDAAAYSIDLRSSSGQIQCLAIRDVQAEGGRNCLRLTNAKFVIVENLLYGGTGTFIDFSNTVQGPVLIDCFAQTGSTITDASAGPITIGYVKGGNPAVSAFGTLSPVLGSSVDVTVQQKMVIGSNTSPSGAQVDVFRDSTYNSEGTGGIYVRSGPGATNVGLFVGTDKTNSTAFIQSTEPATSFGTKTLSLNPNAGNVGINTTTATRSLDLNGTQRYRGQAAPAVSEANSGTIYFDSATNKLKASLNGSAYVDVIGSGGLTGSGSTGRVAYWDSVTSVASPTAIYVDAVNNRLGINNAVPAYDLDVTGDVNVVTGIYRYSGSVALAFDTITGRSWVACGGLSLPATGLASTLVGYAAGSNAIGAVGLTAVGLQAAQNTTGTSNTAVGGGALIASTTGNNNTALGSSAGATNTTGSDNVFLGYVADANANNYTNAVAIGANAVIGASDSMVLGDAAMKVGIRTGTPAQPLDVDGAVAFRHKDIAVVNGLNSDIALTDASLIRLTGPAGAFSIGGFTGGTDGRVLRIINTTAQAMTIVNLDAASAATNQITTLTGADVVLAARTSAATLVYEDATDTWILFSYN